MIIVQKW